MIDVPDEVVGDLARLDDAHDRFDAQSAATREARLRCARNDLRRVLTVLRALPVEERARLVGVRAELQGRYAPAGEFAAVEAAPGTEHLAAFRARIVDAAPKGESDGR